MCNKLILSLTIPPHLKCVATLPCEMSFLGHPVESAVGVYAIIMLTQIQLSNSSSIQNRMQATPLMIQQVLVVLY